MLLQKKWFRLIQQDLSRHYVPKEEPGRDEQGDEHSQNREDDACAGLCLIHLATCSKLIG